MYHITRKLIISTAKNMKENNLTLIIGMTENP
jgi:hypothetical protein